MRKFRIVVDGEEFEVEVEEISGDSTVSSPAPEPKKQRSSRPAPSPKKSVGGSEKKSSTSQPSTVSGDIKAPMPGKILEIKVSPGQEVNQGDVLLVLEAMKMENDVTAPQPGKVKEVSVREGENVEADEVLVKME
ncbi:MAG: biotin/lipoyl-containing protein [Halanaerobiales bacterium]